MFQGNWKCSSCGGAITELPFQPRGEAGLTCRACYSKNKGGQSSTAPDPTPEPDMAVAGEAPDIPDFAELASEPMPGDDLGMGEVPATPSEKPKFQGNWKCATCGGDITSLPFTPRDVTNLKCIDCFKKSRG